MQPATRKTLEIRAHHLLCVFGFRGLGYSDSFVENMQRIVDSFFSKVGVDVEVCDRCDDICAACPHELGGECQAGERSGRNVRAKDRRVLAAAGIGVGARMNSSSLARLVVERVDARALTQICVGCRWLPAGYCREGLDRFRQTVFGCADSSLAS